MQPCAFSSVSVVTNRATRQTPQQYVATTHILLPKHSLVSKAFPVPVFDWLAVRINGGRRTGESHHMIYRHRDIFTFISPVTEKLENQD